MKNYLFSDNITGKEFMVEAKNLTEAREIAKDYCEEPCCINVLNKEQAKIVKFYMN